MNSTWEQTHKSGITEGKVVLEQINDVLANLSPDERTVFLSVLLHGINFCRHCGSELNGGCCECQNDE